MVAKEATSGWAQRSIRHVGATHRATLLLLTFARFQHANDSQVWCTDTFLNANATWGLNGYLSCVIICTLSINRPCGEETHALCSPAARPDHSLAHWSRAAQRHPLTLLCRVHNILLELQYLAGARKSKNFLQRTIEKNSPGKFSFVHSPFMWQW